MGINVVAPLKTGIDLPKDPAILLLGICPKGAPSYYKDPFFSYVQGNFTHNIQKL